jgi:NADH:ubiquinone oxidoreductase subunit 5 (subunit L)/multisubunit Na+/H+ antiporter MnhA subunit
MDILQAVLVFGAVLSPLIAAAAIAATSLSARPRTRLAVRLAQLGAAASTCFALGLLITRLADADVSNASPLSLGRWFVNGPRDLLRIEFALRFDALSAGLAAALAFSTACLFIGRRARDAESPSVRWLPLGASLLLFASIGVVAATNLGELFVFWEIGTAGVYILSSLSAESPQQGIAARKLVLVLSVADALLLCAVFVLAAGFGTLNFPALFALSDWAHIAQQRAGLVDLIGLCILGAIVGRCGMIPFLGWIGDLAGGPRRLAALIEAIALLPCGMVLLARSFPLLHLATPILPLAAFVGGSSAFCLAVCAIADSDFRRAGGYACASVLGTVLLGVATGTPGGPATALGLTIVFVPSATAIALADVSRAQSGLRRWSMVAIVILLSGVCGQALLWGGALESLFASPVRDAPPLLLAVLLAACGQYLAAAAPIRSLVAIGNPDLPMPDEFFTGASRAETSEPGEVSSTPVLFLTGAALAAGLFSLSLSFRGGPRLIAVYAALGLIPGLGGLIAGAQSARADWRVFPSEAVNGLLMRLGRGAFYFDAFLFLFVLVPLRGVAALARFVDWAIIDTLATGGPAALFESAASFFGPLQHRGVFFYLLSALLGTGVLCLLMIWLQG